jgi:hypothetical protein
MIAERDIIVSSRPFSVGSLDEAANLAALLGSAAAKYRGAQ